MCAAVNVVKLGLVFLQRMRTVDYSYQRTKGGIFIFRHVAGLVVPSAGGSDQRVLNGFFVGPCVDERTLLSLFIGALFLYLLGNYFRRSGTHIPGVFCE